VKEETINTRSYIVVVQGSPTKSQFINSWRWSQVVRSSNPSWRVWLGLIL